MSLRVVVTGASGFCGSAVARAAAAVGAEVICLGRRPGPVGEHRYWDATRGAPDLTGADVVLHLAAAVGDPPPGRDAGFHAVNVEGTARLLTAVGGRPLVWVSSASVYTPSREPIREDQPLGGLTAYGKTKAAGERLALAAGAVVLRPRAVYGDGDPHLLPRLRRAIRGGRVLLPGPDIPLSLTAVENLADACLSAVGWPSGASLSAVGQPVGASLSAVGWPAGAYNIADAAPYRRDAIVAAACGVPVRHVPIALARAVAGVGTAVSRFTGREPALSRYGLEQVTVPVVLDIGRARAQGWSPRRTFEDYLAGRSVLPA
ncbi:NAD(P)-dependent oxidoreductase [Actinoplanes sp. L3-i22]|uniref:NAD-dependent epimerase/dehydratase family protein n=1 Tax=Actinoplanes sp. L3-i22 TaxID=2836373 RepID=UPI001C750965|nr:NAD(P)-dependent oxidoreductase [Actinoplanes sp. L3-i22]BCY06868.1 NAD-dependent epimerase [Actinoplanes sp. L3-i22]